MANQTDSKQQGFLLYFDTVKSLHRLDNDSVARFVFACADLVQNGKEPDFADSCALSMLWDNVEPRLIANAANYLKRQDSSAYAGWCSSIKDVVGAPTKIPFEDWRAAQAEYQSFCNGTTQPPTFNQWLKAKQQSQGGIITAADFTNDEGLPWQDS